MKYPLPEVADQIAGAAPPLSKNCVTVLEKRYLAKDDSGEVCETPNELFWRVARVLAEVNRNYGPPGGDGHWHDQPSIDDQNVFETTLDFFKLMRGRYFLPNSPTLANAGTRTGQLSACFVIPVPDDTAGIFNAIRDAALIHQTGGGTGFAFSNLRPRNDLVGSTKGVSSGPIAFTDVFSAATEAMKQGSMRRGANMGILRVDHPDILEFVRHKADLTKLTNFNVSVAITDAFIEAYEKSTDYALLNPRTKEVTGHLDARVVFREIVQRAHATGEPGLYFIDRANAHCPTPGIAPDALYESTNPCGEQPLLPYESCNLGSITLDQLVKTTDTGVALLDWDKLRWVVHTSIQMMDNVVDANRYVDRVPEIKQITLLTRKLGLGVMGLARMLQMLGLKYDRDEGRLFAARVFAFIDFESKKASVELAKKRGAYPYFRDNWGECVNFYKFDLQKRAESALEIGLHDTAEEYFALIAQIAEHGIRNSTTTTVAPTGTLSIIHETTSGCEPVFALATARDQADTKMQEVDAFFRDAVEGVGLDDEQTEHVFWAVCQRHPVDVHGSLDVAIKTGVLQQSMFGEIEWDHLKYLGREIFRTAYDISPKDHVLMQAALQPFCDSAISKTINFRSEATEDDVETAYKLAIKRKLKGITVYRDASRANQPLTAGTHEQKPPGVANPEAEAKFGPVAFMDDDQKRSPQQRPSVLPGFTQQVHTGDGKVYVTTNFENGKMREVFAIIGRSGGTLFSLTEALGRTVSLALQYGVPEREIIHKLRGIRSANVYGFGHNAVLSIPDAIARAMSDALALANNTFATAHVLDTVPALVATATLRPLESSPVIDRGESPECPDCHGPVKFEGGCVSCSDPECSWSKCG